MKEKAILLILVILTAGFGLFGNALGWKLQGFFWGSRSADEARNLAMENAILRTEIAKYQDIQNKMPKWSPSFIPAFVYARYPLNFKNEFLVNAGSKDGVKVGQAVVVTEPGDDPSQDPAHSVLLGKVEQVFDDSALVQTIFDNRFKLAVRTSDGTESLFAGGAEPKLTLIPKSADPKQGEAVYSANIGMAYGLTLGQVQNVSFSNEKMFREATVDLPYDLNALHSVLIVK